jgi:hypothetical protein
MNLRASLDDMEKRKSSYTECNTVVHCFKWVKWPGLGAVLPSSTGAEVELYVHFPHASSWCGT